jgi:Skp family chaperone for outer membrane proteins
MPDAAKIATCDVYQLVERLVESEQYMPARSGEQERIKAQLAPYESQLETMQKELQASDPKDPAAQEKFKTFQAKREEYMGKRQAAADGYTDLVTGQFGDAYQKICAEAKKVATSLGYTYVVAHKKGEIRAHDPRQLVEEFLSRPMSIAPEGVDITEQVRSAMKLPEKAAAGSDSSPLLPTTPSTTPATPPSTPTPGATEAPKK